MTRPADPVRAHLHHLTAARLTQAIREAVEAHHANVQGMTQWWVDEFGIDCDAEEFWKVTEQALAAAIERAS